MNALRFDHALPAVLAVIKQRFGEKLPATTVVRDALGMLSVVLPDEALTDASDWQGLAVDLHRALARYSPGESRVLLRIGDLIDPDDVVQSPDRVPLTDVPNTWLLDRLQTNQDWLRKPLTLPPPLPTAVAFSIKGGVGRTTAFALWAWHLARLGKNVVLVDLDLEAPGVAGVLLDETRLPNYGLVDWLVEALVGPADDFPLEECLGECALSGDEPGRIQVLPALGKKTREYVSKLGRCYVPTLAGENPPFVGLAERLQALLQQLARLPAVPDAILLDARAGLHDVSSAAVTRLGAEVFMFARDDYQSWQAYRLLFEHLRSALSIEWGMPDEDLRWRLGMVAAQVEPTEAARRRFVDRSYETWSGLYDEEADTVGATGQVFSRDDDGPHQPLFIGLDPRVRFFDLIDPLQRPDWQAISQTFEGFFERATSRLFPLEDN